MRRIDETPDGLYRAYGLYHCPWCGDCYHEVLLETYSHTKRPNGTWFRLLPEYGPEGANWTSFPTNDPSLVEADLSCPGCGGIYEDIREKTCWYLAGLSFGSGNQGARLSKSFETRYNNQILKKRREEEEFELKDTWSDFYG